MKRPPINKNLNIQRAVHRLNAEGEIFGRLASRVAQLLIGKHKPQFTYNWDLGDSVIVYNIDKVKITGRKQEKNVYSYTGYPGGIKTKKFGDLLEENPVKTFKQSVEGMLPKNKLKKYWLKRLVVTKKDSRENDDKKQ